MFPYDIHLPHAAMSNSTLYKHSGISNEQEVKRSVVSAVFLKLVAGKDVINLELETHRLKNGQF